MFDWTRLGAEDRWHRRGEPGSYEWWGYEAYDRLHDTVLALRIAVGDPMDPRAGAAGARERPEPDALEPGVLVRFVLYERRRRVLARTFRPRLEAFAADERSGSVRAGEAVVEVEDSPRGRVHSIRLGDGIALRFEGPPGAPATRSRIVRPVWDLASLALAVTGTLEFDGAEGRRRILFAGQGVNDHACGGLEDVASIRAFAFGWAHAREFGVAWRQTITVHGEVETLLLVDREGVPILGEPVRSRPFRSRYSALGIPYRRHWRLDGSSGAGLAAERLATLASSPLGMRFLANVRFTVQDPPGRIRLVDGVGVWSVARPTRARLPPLRWLTLARERWTSRAR